MTLNGQSAAPLYLLTTTAHERYTLQAQTFADAVRRAQERGYTSGRLDLSGLDLSGTDLSGLNLSGTDLSGLNLSGTDLSGLNLSGSWMAGTNLRGTNFTGTRLTGTDLSGSDLTGAVMAGAVLSGARLTCVEMQGADLTGAQLDHTNLRATGLAHANLAGTRLDFTTVGRSLNAAQVMSADTRAVRRDLYTRLRAAPDLGPRLEWALAEGHFIGRARGRVPADAFLGHELGGETEAQVGAAQHWLTDVDPHTPVQDPRLTLALGLVRAWNEFCG